MSTSEYIDIVRDLIVSGHGIGLKCVADTLKISYERAPHCSCRFRHEESLDNMDSQMPERQSEGSTSVSSRSICSRFENDPNFLNRPVTMGEKRVYFCDLETK